MFNHEVKNSIVELSMVRRTGAVLEMTLAIITVLLISTNVFSQGVQRFTRISVSPQGERGNSSSSSYLSGISSDGRYVVFQSYATNLVAQTPSGSHISQVFLRDCQNNQTTLVSVDSHGEPGNDDSAGSTISQDGRFIGFLSNAGNLVSDEDFAEVTSYVYDRETGRTVYLPNIVAANHVALPHISNETLLGWLAATAFPSYAYRRDLPYEVLVSNAATGELVQHLPWPENYSLFNVHGISQDGTFILISNAPVDHVGQSGEIVSLQENLYVLNRLTGQQQELTIHIMEGGNLPSSYPRISANGNFVVFSANPRVNPDFCGPDTTCLNACGNARTCSLVFMYDRSTSQISLVSKNSAGESVNDWSDQADVSGDGRFVVFHSSATNFRFPITRDQVFVRDRQTNKTKIVSAILDGRSVNNSSLNPHISADGKYITFESAASDILSTTETGSIREDVYRSINPSFFHMGCKENACALREGEGEDSCTNNYECQRHTVCRDEACVEEPGLGRSFCNSDKDCQPVCTDTDDSGQPNFGKNPSVAGSVREVDNAIKQTFEDRCLSYELLEEQYCENNRNKVQQYKCKLCKNNACDPRGYMTPVTQNASAPPTVAESILQKLKDLFKPVKKSL